MKPREIEEAARILQEARAEHRQIRALPEPCVPQSLADGYAIQDALIRRIGEPIIGWKVGCITPAAQKAAGTSEPFYGPLLKPDVYASGSRIPARACFVRALQAEFAIRLGKDLSGPSARFDLDAIEEAVAAVLPALEVADSRYLDSASVGAASLIADGAKAGVIVLGSREAPLSGVDLSDGPVRLWVNGERVAEGYGRNVMGNPLRSLQWLANAMARRGASLKAGQIVSTGTCFGSFLAMPGDRAVADFGLLGTVEAEFER